MNDRTRMRTGGGVRRGVDPSLLSQGKIGLLPRDAAAVLTPNRT